MIFLCLTFLTLGFLAFQHPVLLFVLIGFYWVTMLLLYMFFVKHIEQLNKNLVDVQSKASIEKSQENAKLPAVFSKKFDLIDIDDGNIKLQDRVHFNEALSKTLSYAKRHNKSTAILIIDIDLMSGPMKANVSLDDTTIIEIAKKFSHVLRNEDMLAKLDGNEFAVLLNDIQKPKFASAVAEKLLQAIASGLKASMGICICPLDALTLEESIEKTYTALYRAKSMVGSHYQFYTKELDVEAREYTNIKDALQKAIQNNELVLHYQPKLNIKNGSVAGVEVLIRWLHPTLGLLSPDQFIEVAEDSGCIIAMGDWALREACKMNTYWQNEGYEHLTVALNVSSKQFFHPNFLTTLTEVLHDTKLNPSYVELEINEETVMNDLEKSAYILKSIAALGVQISIDHFGIGYTSISHLKHLPINTIKIDREFIHGVALNPNDSAITSAIIALAHYLGISALAEGVENSEQLEFLTQQQCDMVQGYFLSYPLPAEGVVQHFKKISDRALS